VRGNVPPEILLQKAREGTVESWRFLAEYATPKQLTELKIITQKDKKKGTGTGTGSAGGIQTQQTIQTAPAFDEKTTADIVLAEKLGLDAIQAGLREEKKASDAQALIYDEQAAQAAQALEKLRQDQVAIEDQLQRYLENEDAEIQRFASGKGNPRSLWGGVGQFGRAIARALMFLSGPQSILEAMKVDVQREEAESRIRRNAFSDLTDAYKSKEAAAAALELRRGAVLNARMEAVKERAKSANVKNKIDEAQAAYYKRVAELRGALEDSARQTITTTQTWAEAAPGAPGSSQSMVIGGGGGGGGRGRGGGKAKPKGQRAPSTDEVLAVAAASGRAMDENMFKRAVRLPDTGEIVFTGPEGGAEKAQQRLGTLYELRGHYLRAKDLYNRKSKLSAVGALPGVRDVVPSERALLEADYASVTQAIQDTVRGEGFADTGVMSEGEAKRIQSRDFSQFKGVSMTSTEVGNRMFDADLGLINAKIAREKQGLFRADGTPLVGAPVGGQSRVAR